MSVISRVVCGLFALSLCTTILACSDSNPQAPEAALSTVSGTVVYSQTGAPAPGVDVDLQRCAGGMMSDEWDRSEQTSMVTDANGCFRFDYAPQSMHRYRVMVHGATDPRAICNIGDGDPHTIVLRVP
jgi:hypothetical protein